MVYAPVQILANLIESNEPPQPEDKENVPEDSHRQSWNKNQILQLISLYKDNIGLFKSTTTRNEKVWHKISTEMKSHSAEQCRNKFKYLKSKYVEKKDNMSGRATGMKCVSFSYFDEMDEVFGTEPNITPVAIASTSRGERNFQGISTDERRDTILATPTTPSTSRKRDETEDDTVPVLKKRRGERTPLLTDTALIIHREKEEGRNRRHREKMEAVTEFTNAIKALAEAIAKK